MQADIQSIEQRASLENPDTPFTTANIMAYLGGTSVSATGIDVNTESALGVPAIWAAVNFLSGTMASLPFSLYQKQGDSRRKLKTHLANIIHNNVNSSLSSFAWRQRMFTQVLTGGRSYTRINRGDIQEVVGLFPLDPACVTPKQRTDGSLVYVVKMHGKSETIPAADIIDIPYMLKADGLTHRSPIATNRDVIGLGIAITQYGSKFFQNGGVPPFAITGNFQSKRAMDAAAADLDAAVKTAAREERLALTLPLNHELTPIGSDPEKMQMVETKKFLVEEYARIYQLPPMFLQDLSKGTFANTEQQDLHLVKHTVTKWATQVEKECNLKLFGWQAGAKYVEFNLDGLLRGDFKTRMEGYASGVQNALIVPNEARRRENLPDMAGGDDLLIQGATVPLAQQKEAPNGD